MHQLLLDYAASRGRVSYYHLANKSMTNYFFKCNTLYKLHV